METNKWSRNVHLITGAWYVHRRLWTCIETDVVDAFLFYDVIPAGSVTRYCGSFLPPTLKKISNFAFLYLTFKDDLKRFTDHSCSPDLFWYFFHHLPHIIKIQITFFFVFGCSCVRRLKSEAQKSLRAIIELSEKEDVGRKSKNLNEWIEHRGSWFIVGDVGWFEFFSDVASLRRRLIMMIIDSKVDYYSRRKAKKKQRNSGAANAFFLRCIFRCVLFCTTTTTDSNICRKF